MSTRREAAAARAKVAATEETSFRPSSARDRFGPRTCPACGTDSRGYCSQCWPIRRAEIDSLGPMAWGRNALRALGHTVRVTQPDGALRELPALEDDEQEITYWADRGVDLLAAMKKVHGQRQAALPVRTTDVPPKENR